MHPRVLKEQADIVAKPFSIISKKPWLSGKPESAKRETAPILKKERPEGLQASDPCACGWEDHGADPAGRYAKAHVRQ